MVFIVEKWKDTTEYLFGLYIFRIKSSLQELLLYLNYVVHVGH